MPKVLSIEQKAELYDKILGVIKSYYKNLDDDLDKIKPKKKPKEKVNNGTISFHKFSSIYQRPDGMQGAGKYRNELNDDDRQKALDYIPTYYKEKFTIKDGVQFMVGPIRYIRERKREEKSNIDYKDLKIFNDMQRAGKVDVLKENLKGEYLEVYREWKESDLYLKG